MVLRRRKGVAIVHTSKGILVVAGRSKEFQLPGGGAERWESRKKAAIRELYEETGLKTKKIKYLFRYKGSKWHAHNGKLTQNYSKVFLIESEGIAKPKHEVRYVHFWRPGDKINLSRWSKEAIHKYLKSHAESL